MIQQKEEKKKPPRLNNVCLLMCTWCSNSRICLLILFWFVYSSDGLLIYILQKRSAYFLTSVVRKTAHHAVWQASKMSGVLEVCAHWFDFFLSFSEGERKQKRMCSTAFVSTTTQKPIYKTILYSIESLRYRKTMYLIWSAFVCFSHDSILRFSFCRATALFLNVRCRHRLHDQWFSLKQNISYRDVMCIDCMLCIVKQTTDDCNCVVHYF